MPIVNDIDRPDVSGVPPKMKTIAESVSDALAGLLPFLTVGTDDNLMSSVTVRGTKEPKEAWSNGIFHNATYFIVQIVPPKGRRYYDPADKNVTLEVISGSRKLPKLRKSTGTVEKIIARLKEWVAAIKETP